MLPSYISNQFGIQKTVGPNKALTRQLIMYVKYTYLYRTAVCARGMCTYVQQL